MNDAFQALDHSILSAFGQSILLTYSDQSTEETLGIISKELVQVGQYEAVADEITVLTINSKAPLKRGTLVDSQRVQWVVDRKIRNDGQLARWNLHET